MKHIKLLALLLGLFSMVVLTQSCEEDKCADITCLNDGVCVDGTCDCPDGYSGTTCETHCSSSLLGTYNVTVASYSGLETVVLTAGSKDSEVTITMTYDGGQSYPNYIGETSNNCTDITLAAQPASGIFTPLENASISVNGSTLTGDFTWGADNLTFTAEK